MVIPFKMSSSSSCSSSTDSSSSCSDSSDSSRCTTSSSSSTCDSSSSSSSTCKSSDSSSSTSSSSSSSDSGECFPREYKRYLDEKHKHRLTAPEIYYKFRDAVVSIQTVTFQEGKVIQSDVATGFFIGCRYILTTAGVLTYDNRGLQRVERIFVYVVNTDGCNTSTIYEGSLVAIDGAANLGLIYISEANNKGKPKLDGHNFFRFGRSRDYCIGREVYSIVNGTGDEASSFRQGVVINNRQFSKIEGTPPLEIVTVQIPALNKNYGAPIIDCYGNVIAIINYNLGNTTGIITGGTSEYAMEPILDAFHEAGLALTKNKKLSCYKQHLRLVNSPFGNYYVYVKGFLGIQWTNYSPAFFPNGQTKYDKVQGIIVVGVDQTTPLGQAFSQLIAQDNNILITEIDGCPVGNIQNQISPALITWRKVPGDKVKIQYRVSSDSFKQCLALNVALGAYPPSLDTPHTGWMVRKDSANTATATTNATIDSKDVKTGTATQTSSGTSSGNTLTSETEVNAPQIKSYSNPLKLFGTACVQCHIKGGACGSDHHKKYLS